MKAPLALLCVVGCAHAVRPVVFASPVPSDSAIEETARVLGARGYVVALMDEDAGVVQTEWQSTAYRYGTGPHGADAHITRRFSVRIAPSGEGSLVTAYGEDLSCEGTGDVGSCDRVDGVVGPDQEEIERIAADLERVLR
jgi:hypothetical protein